MDAESKTRLRKYAHAYLGAGLSLAVVGQDKRPIHTWKQYQTEMITPGELNRQLDRPEATGVAVIGGAISGGAPDQWLAILDFDEDAAECYGYLHGWLGSSKAFGGAGWDQDLMAKLPLIRTGKEAYRCQMYVRVQGGAAPGNQKLAFGIKDGVEYLMVETRCEGGYALAPASLHPSGNYYRHMRGNICKIPVIDFAKWEEVTQIIGYLDRRPKVTRQPIPMGAQTVTLNALPGWLIKMCAEGARPGERNSKLVEVRCALIEYGAAGADLNQLTTQFLHASGYGRNRAELAEIEATLTSADRRASYGSKKNIVRVA